MCASFCMTCGSMIYGCGSSPRYLFLRLRRRGREVTVELPLTCRRHNEELRLGLDAATQQGAWGSDRGQRYKGAITDREACQVLRVLCTFLGDRCAERSLVSAPVLTAQFLDRADRGTTGSPKFWRRAANLRYSLRSSETRVLAPRRLASSRVPQPR